MFKVGDTARLALLLALWAPAMAKDSVNSADYPENATVTSTKIVTEATGTKTTAPNPGCYDPQTAFMKGFCAQQQTRTRVTTQKYVEVIATIGSNVYTLQGDKLPPPGQYKARFWDNGDIELMGPNAKGELRAHRFKVIGIEAIPAK
ncbi:MAG TPA: hypothetical protein VIH89_05390 [Candidatus Sulfotelmatobacter sp.]